MARSRLPIGQKWLLDCQAALGYPGASTDAGGICDVIAYQGMIAYLLGPEELENFNQRFFTMHSVPAEELEEEIELARQRWLLRQRSVKGNERAGASEDLLLSIPPFFELVELYHHPENYRHLVASDLKGIPLLEALMTLVAPQKLQPKESEKESHKGSIDIFGDFTGAYDVDD